MARPRSFDTLAALDSAAKEFRVHGFDKTSTEQLCEAAGVKRSSLYNAFVSKDELFVRALERYTEAMTQLQTEVLTDPEREGGARLWRIVELAVDEERVAREEGHAAGCMIVQSYMSPDLREGDPRVQALLDRDLARRLALMADAARAGQRDGSVNRQIAPQEVALLVVTMVSGLRVTAAAGAEPDLLLQIAATALASVLTAT